MKPTIEIIVSLTGEITIDAVAFQGADCEKATAYLENALGVPGSRRKKPEYRQTRNTRSQQRVGG